MLTMHFLTGRMRAIGVAVLIVGFGLALGWDSAGPPAAAASNVVWPSISLQQVATGLNMPVTLTNAGDDSGRLFIVEQPGEIKILKNGTVQPTAFLNITDRVLLGAERGLLGLAFPPGYGPAKPHFYVYYTNLSGDLVTARYTVSGNPDVANHDPEQVVLTVPHPVNANHNGGQLAFGPDGYLYLGPGDGGGGGDPNNNAQNTNLLLGKILRIDVETGNPASYTIPPTNPFYNQAGKRGEIWAYGVRNPWRFSFDRLTHDLYIGDVGQNCYEEVDVQPASSTGGENYGWRLMEGLHQFDPNNPSNCSQPLGSGAGLTFPKLEYPHPQGCAIVGGYVYRGALYSRLKGIYLYSDECSGQIYGLTNPGGTWQSQLLYSTGFTVSTFGEDEAGELYITSYVSGGVSSSRVFKIRGETLLFAPVIFR